MIITIINHLHCAFQHAMIKGALLHEFYIYYEIFKENKI